MFVRIEVAIKPEYSDPTAQSLLKRIQGQLPELRKKIRWARLIDVYWLDVPRPREDIIPACQEIFQDRVTQWLFTGNLIPSASGKEGGLEDLMEASPIRPGKFLGLERRLRAGLADSRAQAALEAMRVVLGSELEGASTSTGQLLLLEGAQLDEASLAQLAREVWCNQVSETWTILPEHELVSNDRFHQEKRSREDVPKIEGAASTSRPSLQAFARKLNSPRISAAPQPGGAGADSAPSLAKAAPEELLEYSRARHWAWAAEHWNAIREYWSRPGRSAPSTDPTQSELEVIAACWSEQARSRIWSGRFASSDGSRSYSNLGFETLGATVQQQPQPWLVSANDGRPAILALSDEVHVSWSARVSTDGSSKDAYADTLGTILGAQTDLMGADEFSLPLVQTQAFQGDLIQKGVLLRASELASNRTQVPMLAGADLGELQGGGAQPFSQPLMISSIVGAVVGRERGRILAGDRLGWVAAGSSSMEDPVYQRKLMDALQEARSRGLLSGLRSSQGMPAVWAAVQLAREAGGASITLLPALFGSLLSRRESLLVSARPDRWSELKAHMDAWGVELAVCGGLEHTGRIRINRGNELAVDLSLEFLWEGAPSTSVIFEAPGENSTFQEPSHPPFKKGGDQVLLQLLSQPEVRSPGRILQAFDLEARAHSVIRPLHSVAASEGDWSQGPNDGTVFQVGSQLAALGVGSSNRKHAPSVAWRTCMAIDEALRNLVCTGAQVGGEDSLCALSIQWRGESPERHPQAAGELVEALEAVKDASLSLGIPVVSAASSFSSRPLPGLLACHALGRLSGIRWARSADFKVASDVIYLLGPECTNLVGSLFAERFGSAEASHIPGGADQPMWMTARNLYGWMSGARGKEQGRIRSLHDVSDGGLLVALAEGVMARGLGVQIRMPEAVFPEAWAFGEGFHRMVLSCSEADSAILESEWDAFGIRYQKVGLVTANSVFEVAGQWRLPVAELRRAWRAEEVWT